MKVNELHGLVANAIVAQMIGDGIVKGGSGLCFRFGEKNTRNYRFFLKKSENSLRIEVANTWRNRVVYNLDRPERRRKTWILYRKNFSPPPKSPMVPAGLLGPVKIFAGPDILQH